MGPDLPISAWSEFRNRSQKGTREPDSAAVSAATPSSSGDRLAGRRSRHRHAALCFATTILIVGKLLTYRDRWSPR